MNRLQMLWTLLLAALLTSTGCREEKPVDEIISLEGKVEKIEPRPDGTGKITVVYRDKKNNELAGIGEVNKDTEIMINGALAKLSDLKVGERIRGQVKLTKDGKDRKQTVLKISVDRVDATKQGEPTGSP